MISVPVVWWEKCSFDAEFFYFYFYFQNEEVNAGKEVEVDKEQCVTLQDCF